MVGRSGIDYNTAINCWSSDDDEEVEKSPEQLLEDESRRVHKKFMEKKVDWAALFPDIGFSSDDHMDIMELLPLNIGKVYSEMDAED